MTKAGRPSFEPTPEQRRQVEELISCGQSHGEIAQRLGISEPTLRRHFSDELANGRARRRAEVIELLYETARKGNVAALRQLEYMTDAASAAASDASAKPPLRLRMGKKAEAAEAASSAGLGTDWGDDLQTPPTVN